MSTSDFSAAPQSKLFAHTNFGLFWLLVACVGAALVFQRGIEELLIAWQTPEYSHGPLIPVLSGLMFLRELKAFPPNPGEVRDRWPGVVVVIFSLLLGLVGNFVQIGDIVAYALILWVAGVLLTSFGWSTGKHFWPPVLHLVYMLPLPGALYYGVSTWLQMVSSELSVWILQMMRVPVFLDGNIIDLGVMKLQVAEACSGLRYLFPIMSFSYIFAVLYRGPVWHKAVLLISAAPITVVMNSVRIAVASVIANTWGVETVEGFTHFFEGWVIFMLCIVFLFGLAWFMMQLHPDKPTLAEALDLDTTGLGAQALRIRLIRPSAALIVGAVLAAGAGVALKVMPQRELAQVERDPFALFPRELGAWQSTPPQFLDAETEMVLAADDYYSVSLISAEAEAPVQLFMAWYRDLMTGGTHSPTVCLPGAGWEIAALEQIDAPADASGAPFTLNRAVIQNGVNRMMVYYWYDQQGIRTPSSWRAKMLLTLTKARTGRSDGALVRLITAIDPNEDDAAAEARLIEAVREVVKPLPRFVPGA